jgi:glycosyltransferase involved in cell wall biosynthesis
MAAKIAFVMANYFRSVVTDGLLLVAQDQRRRGRQVEYLVGRNISTEFLKETERQGFPVTQIPSMRKYIHPMEDTQAVVDLARVLKRKRFDIVHTHITKAGVLGRLAARIAGVSRIIHSVHGPTFAPTVSFTKRFLYRNIEKIAGRGTDLFIFVGRDLRDFYIESRVCSEQNSVVINLGLNLDSFIQSATLPEKERDHRRRALGCEPDTIILGNVSRLVPWKGHNYALEVLHRLLAQNLRVKLIIVGDAVTPTEKVFKQKLLDMVRDFDLENQVVFTGWQQNPAPYYGLFDMYLLTSTFEGLPNAVIESASVGLPVVGFSCFGMREIPGFFPRLVPMRDVEGLTAAVKEQIAQLPRMTGIPRTRPDVNSLLSRFSMSRMVAEVNNQYERLLDKPSDRDG